MPQKLADKYLLAVGQAIKEKPSSGLNGFEQDGIYSMKDNIAANTCGISIGELDLTVLSHNSCENMSHNVCENHHR